jgi:glycogen operon protein
LVNGDQDLTGLVASLCRLRLSTRVLHRSRFFAEGEVQWLRPDGEQMSPDDWNEPFAHAVGLTAPGGRFTLLINAWWEPLSFRLPAEIRGESLSSLVDTARDGAEARHLGLVDDVVVAGRSLMLLERSASQP